MRYGSFCLINTLLKWFKKNYFGEPGIQIDKIWSQLMCWPSLLPLPFGEGRGEAFKILNEHYERVGVRLSPCFFFVNLCALSGFVWGCFSSPSPFREGRGEAFPSWTFVLLVTSCEAVLFSLTPWRGPGWNFKAMLKTAILFTFPKYFFHTKSQSTQRNTKIKCNFLLPLLWRGSGWGFPLASSLWTFVLLVASCEAVFFSLSL